LVGAAALFLQRFVRESGGTQVELPLGIRLTTNYPALVFAMIGLVIALFALNYETKDAQERTADAQRKAAEAAVTTVRLQGSVSVTDPRVEDVYLAIIGPGARMVSASESPQPVTLTMTGRRDEAMSATVVGMARRPGGRYVTFATPTSDRSTEDLTFSLEVGSQP
jgi:hypothetical protein